jgi:hypothetical protein
MSCSAPFCRKAVTSSVVRVLLKNESSKLSSFLQGGKKGFA